MTDVKGCHAIVTGGSSGIGLAVASLLAAKGAKVSLIARDDTKLVAGVAQIHDAAPSAAVATAPADVTDPVALGDAVAEVTEAQGPCDVLVACAGSAHPGYFVQLDDAVFRQQMEVDYFGTLHAVRAVVPAMIGRGRGHLVLVSSTAGAHRCLRLLGLRAGEVRGARPGGDAAPRARAPRHRGRVRVPARHARLRGSTARTSSSRRRR